MKITSTAFDEGAMIPRKYTCDDIDISPPLQWSNEPEGTKVFAIICDDPDAPMGTWVHWVLYNLPADTNKLPEDIPPVEILPNGAKQGRNDMRKIGYGGPCPPGGTHRYYFKIYALAEELNIEPGCTKSELLKAMEGKILSEGQLMGRYKR
ncbi:MAG: YbhB/YbcL family Raf kinase inhibitor-like protein [Ignavibacteria bacterium]